jgi:hypothetical protein
MKILIACEKSGVVREAFRLKGHDVWSCDLQPTDIPGQHYQGSVFDILNEKWDMLIGHPPCTFLSYAGIAHWNKPGRLEKRLDALNFFARLWLADIEKICLENPKSCASPTIAKYTQEIQPYYFGDNDLKTTWLWLKNLPPLIHVESDNLFEQRTHTDKPEPFSIDNTPRQKKRYFVDGASRDQNVRSKTFQGIANAMADQWG